jgi:uncharacterized protein YceH (UPF0502 family)
MALQLSPVETRILGCLLEKERVTPENYPLSLHSLTAACNQATNREPVVGYDEKTVEAGLDSLRGKKLATMIWGAGARVQKYRHNLLDFYNLDARDVALLCVLLLRGPQTPGELRSRTDRLHPFESTFEVEEVLQTLAQCDAALVRVIPPRPGQKEKRWVQLLSDETETSEPVIPEGEVRSQKSEVRSQDSEIRNQKSDPSRIGSVEAELAALKADLAALREEFRDFKKQFDP